MTDNNLPSSKRRKNNQPIEEEYPILKQEDFKTSINNLADLPDYLERINQNILNIDKRISKKEIQTDKVREFARLNPVNEYNHHHKKESLTDIKDLVKQSVEGINDIFKSQQPMPEPHPQPYQQQHQLSNPSDRKKVNNNLKSVVMKSNTHEEEANPGKKNSQKAIIAGKDNKESNKKSFKIDITKFSTDANVNPTKETIDRKKKISHNNNNKDKDKEQEKDKNLKNSLTQGNNKKIINNEYTPSKCVVNQIKEQRQKSKSPVPNKNYFPFKPKNNRKDMTGSEISIENDIEKSIKNIDNEEIIPAIARIKPVSAVLKNNNHAKQLFTSPNSTLKKDKDKEKTKEKNKENLKNNEKDKDKETEKDNSDVLEKSLNSKKSPKPKKKQPKPQPQYLSQPQSQVQVQVQPQPQISNTLPKRQQIAQSKSPNLYSKEMPKEGGTIDLLHMMLFFNEYIISQHNIKDYAFHQETLKQYSTLLTSLLHQDIQQSMTQRHLIEEESTKSRNVLLIQRRWRTYKFKSLIPDNQTQNEVLKKMMINSYIEKEGFNARKIIGMINESLDSFTKMKSKFILFTYII